jgi:hypothetical protein
MDDVPRRSCFTETSFQLIRLRLTAQLVTDITQLARGGVVAIVSNFQFS